jgi:hypothetical protein
MDEKSTYFCERYASPHKHEHWIRSEDGSTVGSAICILTEPNLARCVAPQWRTGATITGTRVRHVARPPQYVLRVFADDRRDTY